MVKSVKFLYVCRWLDVEKSKQQRSVTLVGWLVSWALIGFYGISLDIIVDLMGLYYTLLGLTRISLVFFMFFFFLNRVLC